MTVYLVFDEWTDRYGAIGTDVVAVLSDEQKAADLIHDLERKVRAEFERRRGEGRDVGATHDYRHESYKVDPDREYWP